MKSRINYLNLKQITIHKFKSNKQCFYFNDSNVAYSVENVVLTILDDYSPTSKLLRTLTF